MRTKIILVLLAVMGLICVCCKDNTTTKNTAEVVEVIDTVSVAVDSTNVVVVDTLVVE